MHVLSVISNQVRMKEVLGVKLAVHEPVPFWLVAVNFIGLPKFAIVAKHFNVQVRAAVELSTTNPQFQFSLNHLENSSQLLRGCTLFVLCERGIRAMLSSVLDESVLMMTKRAPSRLTHFVSRHSGPYANRIKEIKE